MSDTRPCLQDLSVAGLRARFAEQGVEPWRAEQVAAWLYARGVLEPEAWTDLPSALRSRLAAEWRTRALAPSSTVSHASTSPTRWISRQTARETRQIMRKTIG